ncbi:MAG: DUF465 domain-containing protein [Alphaproteobacteria bacterium]|nr:DUF465 domain-containing protein [Alphaproteobacteria bacterium]
MSHTPHELHQEFPQHAEALHQLKMSNAHFQRLSQDYERINKVIHKAEAGLEPMDDAALEGLKKQRLHIKDDIAKLLTA